MSSRAPAVRLLAITSMAGSASRARQMRAPKLPKPPMTIARMRAPSLATLRPYRGAATERLLDCPSVTLIEKGGWLWQGWNPAQFMLRRPAERGSETTEEEMGVQLVRFAG